MKQIVKGREPASLVQYRHEEYANYDDYRDKDTLRQLLVAEQRGICCYCMKGISPRIGDMKIEHWHSQERYLDEQLDYRNLLAACMGNEGQKRKHQTCDTRKGEDDLSRNPANPDHAIEHFVRFAGDGAIISDDEVFNREINEVLNLNEARLKNNRKAALDAFKMALGKRELQRHSLERWLRDWNGESDNGALRPYCQVVVYWLRKRLSRN